MKDAIPRLQVSWVYGAGTHLLIDQSALVVDVISIMTANFASYNHLLIPMLCCVSSIRMQVHNHMTKQ